MSTEKNVQIVKDFFAAMGSYNEHDLLALAAELAAGRHAPAGTRNWRLCSGRRPKRWK
jgi:hypothetical protein